MTQRREAIIKRIFETSEAMKRGMYGHMLSYFQHLPVSRSQLEVLSAIKYMQPVSSKELANQLHLSPGAVSQSVDALEQDGYIVRKADAKDRRIQYLTLTPQSTQLLQDIDNQRKELLGRVMQELSLEELEVWLKVQSKTSMHLQNMQPKTPAPNVNTKETK